MPENKGKSHRLLIPKEEKVIGKWIEKQSNKSTSIRELLKIVCSGFPDVDFMTISLEDRMEMANFFKKLSKKPEVTFESLGIPEKIELNFQDVIKDEKVGSTVPEKEVIEEEIIEKETVKDNVVEVKSNSVNLVADIYGL